METAEITVNKSPSFAIQATYYIFVNYIYITITQCDVYVSVFEDIIMD